MKLKEDQLAKNFTMRDYFKGNDIKLQDYKGKKILLTFYRFAMCPFSNYRLGQVIEMFPTLQEKGLSIIGVFESSNSDNVETFIGNRHNPPFPIIADPEKLLYEQYGLGTSTFGLIKSMFHVRKMFKAIAIKKYFPMPTKIDSTMNRMPADFLIDENFIIKKVHYGKDIGDHISDKEIYDFIS